MLTSLFDDAKAAGEAALLRDFDEARFRTQQLVTTAYGLGLAPLAVAAALLGASLGPAGSPPKADYGVGMLRLADELDAVRLPPLSEQLRTAPQSSRTSSG
jgi:hypothetical protein